MKVWTRGRAACFTASPARSMSASPARDSPHTTEFLKRLGDLGDGLEVAIRGDREARLDDVDPHGVEEVGDLQLLLEGHGGAGALLAIAQGCIENEDFVGVGAVLLHGRSRLGVLRHGGGPQWRPDEYASGIEFHDLAYS